MVTYSYKTFEEEKEELLESCDICTGSHLTYFWSGEHSVVDGGASLVGRIPEEVLVGIKGKIPRDKAKEENGPKLRTPKAIDPVTGEFDPDVSDPFKYAEELKDFSKIIRDIPYGIRGKTDYLPAEVRILSTTPPGRGCNFSGALASALASSVLLLNGEELGLKEGEPKWAVPAGKVFTHEKFQDVFRYAMKIETVAHEDPSGYGPLFDLLHGDEGPFLFSPVNDKDNEIKQAGVSSWPAETSPLGKHSGLGVLVVDSGVEKSTKQAIRSARRREEEIEETLEGFAANIPDTDGNLKEPLFRNTVSFPGPLHRILDGLSVVMINSVRRYCMESPEENFQKIVQTVRAIDRVHGLMGLHWDRYLTTRKLLYSRHGREIGCKLTGGGGGGDFVVFTKKELVPPLRETLSTVDVGVIYDSTEDEPPTAGTKLHEWTNPEKIASIEHFGPLQVTTLADGVTSRKEVPTTEELGTILDVRETLKEKERPPKRLIVANKDRWQLNLYELRTEEEGSEYRSKKFERRPNKSAAIELLCALTDEEVKGKEKLEINTSGLSRLTGKEAHVLSENIASPLGRDWVKEDQRNPFRVQKNAPAQPGKATVTFKLPSNCALITVSGSD